MYLVYQNRFRICIKNEDSLHLFPFQVIGSSYDSLGSRVLRHFHHHIDNTRHTWFYASNKATTHHNNRGTQLSSGAGENAEPEAETVSVFPDNQRRTISASTSQRNAGESSSARLGENNVSGGGGSDGVGGEGAGVELESARKASQEAEELSAHGDETDSAWLSSQHGVHVPFQPHGSRKRGREQQFSSTSGACHLGDSPLTQIERNHMLSHSLVSSQVDSPPMDKTMVSQGIHPTTSSHQDRTMVSQEIHLMTSSHQDKMIVSQGIHPETSSHQDRTMVSQEIRPTTSSHQNKMIVSQGIHPTTSSHQDRTVVSQGIHSTTSSHQDRMMVSQGIHPATSSHQDRTMVSQRIHPTTSSHHGGHLKLSGNGTLSLSLGSESAHKKLKTNPDGS